MDAWVRWGADDHLARWSHTVGMALFRSRRVGSLVVGAAIVTTLAFEAGPLFGVGALFVVIVPFERLFPRHRQRVRRPQLGTDVAYALLAGPLGAIGLTVAITIGLGSLFWVPGLLFRPVVTSLPPSARLVVAFVLFDLLVYWAHRYSHEVPFLWRFHAIHHSTVHLDWVSGFRTHPFDGVLLAPAFAFVAAAGFSPKVSGALLAVQVITGLFLHANVKWRLRVLQKLVVTPEFHHWHHANEIDAHNSNYAAFLPMWDVWFGSYFVPADRRPVVYGVSDTIPMGLVAQLRYPFRGLANPFRLARHPRAACRRFGANVRRGVGQVLRVTFGPRFRTMK